MDVAKLLGEAPFDAPEVFSLRGERVSGHRFEAEVRAWAALLRDVPDPAIPIFGHMHPSMMAAWVGAVRAGKLPAFISYPTHKIRLEDYQVKLWNYQGRLKNRIFVGLPGDPVQEALLLTPERLSRGEVPPVSVQRGPDEPLFLQCSSGSTGLQKAVAITSRQLRSQLDGYARAIQVDRGRDRIASWLPLYHDMGLVTGFVLPLLAGIPLALIDTFDWASNPALLLDVIQRERSTLCWLPNFAFLVLSRIGGGHDLSSVRAFVSAAEPVSREAFQAFARRHGVRPSQLAVCYGLAENVFAVTQTPPGQPPRALALDRARYQEGLVEVRGPRELDGSAEPGPPAPGEQEIWSCGPVVPGTEVCLEVEAGKDIGEILVRGPGTVPGYHEQPPSQDADGWLPTGDLGFVHQGELYCCGRKKDLIIHHGRNLFPQDLEQIASADPEVHPGRTVAVGDPDPRTGSEEVFLLFEPRDFLGLERRALASLRLKRQLEVLVDADASVILVPRMWLKKTSSGKIARRANLEAYRASRSRLIHVWGTSHCLVLTGFRGLRPVWIGPHVGSSIHEHTARLTDLARRLAPGDVFILQGGEPECRTVLPAAPDPLQRIEASVAAYRECLQRVRAAWPGTLAFMTDIPTQWLTFDHCDPTWRTAGTGEERYRYQAIYYRRMEEMCREEGFVFLDVCTPLIGPDGYMDNSLRADSNHLHRKHVDYYVRLLEGALGPIDWEPLPPAPTVWDGTRPHFDRLARDLVRAVASGRGEPDWQHLVSGGTLASMAIAELTMRLCETFQVEIPLPQVSRERFESLDSIFEHYVRGKAATR